MKNMLKTLGFIAIVAVISISLLSCPQEEKKAGVSLPSAPGIDKAPGFPGGATAANYEEALQLFNSAFGSSNQALSSFLSEAYMALFDTAFKEKNGGDTLEVWGAKQAALSSVKVDVPVAGTEGDVTVSKGKTAVELKLSGLILSEYVNFTNNPDAEYGLTKDNQSATTNTSVSATFTFPLTQLKYKNSSGTEVTSNYHMGGVLIVEQKSSDTQTLKDQVNDIYTSKDSREFKYAFALTVYDSSSSLATRFRMSSASKGSGSLRKISDESYSEKSDLEMYASGTTLLGKPINASFYSAGQIANKLLAPFEAVLGN